MDASVKKIVKWAVIGGLVAFVIDWIVSGSVPMGHRVVMGLMAAGAGFVTAALLAANFSADEETGTHGPTPH
jgi:hypothetical protein